MEFSKWDGIKPRMLVLVDYMNQLWPAVVIDVFKGDTASPSKQKKVTVMWLDKICTESTVPKSKIVPFHKSWFKAYASMNQKKGSQVKDFNESLVLALKLAAGDSYVGITVQSLSNWMKSGKKVHRDTISDGELHFLLCQGKMQREQKKRKSNNATPEELLPLVNRICAFKCKESNCDERFSVAQDRDWHNFTFHKGWYQVCQQCNEVFEWKGDAESHIKEEHPECLDEDEEIKVGVLKRTKMIECPACHSLIGSSEEDQSEHKEECDVIMNDKEIEDDEDEGEAQDKEPIQEKQKKQKPKLKVSALTRESLKDHSKGKQSGSGEEEKLKNKKRVSNNKLSDATVSSSSTKTKEAPSIKKGRWSISPPRSDSHDSEGAPSEELNGASQNQGQNVKCSTCDEEFSTPVERIVHETLHKSE